MRPIVMIPGIGGSILVQKGAETRRLFHKSVPDNRWVNIYVASKHGLSRWKRDMRCDMIYDDTGRITGVRPEINHIYAYDFGGTKGIKDIMPEFLLLPPQYQNMLDDMFHHRYFHALSDQMYGYGYRDNYSLFGAPYDFRFILDPQIRSAYFKQLQSLIEGACKRTGERAVIVTHSLGGIMLKWFATVCVSQEWIDKHIERWVCISAPFGGSYHALYAATSGEHYIPSMRSSVQMELQRNLGIIACFPNDLAFDKNEVLLQADESVTIETYSHLAQKGLIPFRLWTDLYKDALSYAIKPPVRIPTHVVCGSKMNSTMGRGVADAWDTPPSRMEYITGDGIVPLHSLLSIEKIVNPKYLTETIIYNNEVNATDHTSLLCDDRVMKIVRDYALKSYKTI